MSAGQIFEWKSGSGYRSAPLAIPSGGKSGFSLLSPSNTGIDFTNYLADRTVAFNRVYENGSGVALGDVDGDGWCDIYFCRLEGRNALYRNLGNWRFEDITESSGVACPDQFSTGTALADIDGDNDLDLLVNAIGGGTRAFLNDGKAKFTELTGTRLVRRFGSTSFALADIDADGDLDLYVTNYRTDTYKDRPPGLKVEARMVGGKIVVTPPDRFIPIMPRAGAVEVIELGERDFLYINDGSGRFAPVSWTAGTFLDEDSKPLTEPPKDWGLAVMFRDMDGNGSPDMYVCNDFFYSPDRIWLSRDSKGFQAAPRTAFRNMSLASMALDFADINRDGHDDLFVVDMLSRSHSSRHRQRPNMMKGLVETPVSDPNFRPEVARNTLHLSRGDGTFTEIAQLSGLAATEWSWGAIFLDVDLDGYEDLLVATGNSHDVQDADTLQQIATVRDNDSPEERLKRFPRLETPNLAFRNRGDLTFEDMSSAWGFDLVGISHGMALGDLDNDGDQDVVVNNLNAPASLYRNESAASRIAIRLKGATPNTRGVGAKIRVLGGPVSQSQEMISGGRYLSCDDALRVFAGGSQTNRLRIEVTWRNGRKSSLENIEPNRIYEIDEAGAQLLSPPADLTSKPARSLFQDTSRLLSHTHIDEPFDDFGHQPLLPHRLSQLGPGISWIDYDHDGWEDLVVGSGKGGRLMFFRNDGKGGFSEPVGRSFESTTRDQTSILGWQKSASNTVFMVGLSNFEDKLTNIASVRLYDPMTAMSSDLLPGNQMAIGPMALSDIDGDGDLDLFVGGRVKPEKYPEPVSSSLYRNIEGRFELDVANSQVLDKVGLVSGATFSDLNGDGRSELILACHWGPIRVYRQKDGVFSEITRELGLDQFTGWWNGVTTGDFNNDGRLDFVASNWGRNTRFQSFLEDTLKMYAGDFDENGTVEVIEGYTDPATKKIVPWRDYETVSLAMPSLRERITSFRAFGNASIEEILASDRPKATEYRANTLDSMVFMNLGERFEGKSLPLEAQFAPAFGLVVNDFNGDGNEDVVLSQNFYGVEPETSRYDGGQGLLLNGDGKGNFVAQSARMSGIEIYGEQRGCAAADYDGDGRVDLAIGQNRGATRVFQNIEGHPGIRIRLIGPAENPKAVGAILRLQTASGFGLAREVQAGTGYLSQNGAVQILNSKEPITGIWVRWPGGKETRTAIELPQQQKNVTIQMPNR